MNHVMLIQMISIDCCWWWHPAGETVIPILSFISFLLLAAEWSPCPCVFGCILNVKSQRNHYFCCSLTEHKGFILTKNTLELDKGSAHTNTQWVPQTNCLLIVIRYHLKWYNQSPRNVNQANKPSDLLNNCFMPCASSKRAVASAKCYRRRVSADWHGECEKYNYKPGATERANALADRTKRREEIYGEKCYLGSIIYSSQMDWVTECMGLNQAPASGT